MVAALTALLTLSLFVAASLRRAQRKRAVLKVKKLSEYAKIPTRNNPTDGGLDLYASRNIIITPHGGSAKIPTGIAIQLPENTVGQIWPRSKISRSFKSLILGGVIDCGYRGEIMVALMNNSSKAMFISAGDKIAQLLIHPLSMFEPVEVEELDDSQRGVKGINDADLRL